MGNVRLGKTGIVVEKNAFGALPIQRISQAEAVWLLRKAYERSDIANAMLNSAFKAARLKLDLLDKKIVFEAVENILASKRANLAISR